MPQLRATLSPKATEEQLPQNLPELKTTTNLNSKALNLSNFLNSSVSKKSTLEHVKRVQKFQANRQVNVVYIDPNIGPVYPDISSKTTKNAQPISPKTNKGKFNLLKTHHQLHKQRQSPF